MNFNSSFTKFFRNWYIFPNFLTFWMVKGAPKSVPPCTRNPHGEFSNRAILISTFCEAISKFLFFLLFFFFNQKFQKNTCNSRISKELCFFFRVFRSNFFLSETKIQLTFTIMFYLIKIFFTQKQNKNSKQKLVY